MVVLPGFEPGLIGSKPIVLTVTPKDFNPNLRAILYQPYADARIKIPKRGIWTPSQNLVLSALPIIPLSVD